MKDRNLRKDRRVQMDSRMRLYLHAHLATNRSSGWATNLALNSPAVAMKKGTLSCPSQGKNEPLLGKTSYSWFKAEKKIAPKFLLRGRVMSMHWIPLSTSFHWYIFLSRPSTSDKSTTTRGQEPRTRSVAHPFGPPCTQGLTPFRHFIILCYDSVYMCLFPFWFVSALRTKNHV